MPSGSPSKARHDPPLPGIVFIHGMAGGHLEREDGKRVWLNAATLFRGTLPEEIQGALNPAGQIKLFHRPAAYYWRRQGFRVYEFAYDWRLSLDDAAARLDSFIADLPDSRLIVAAHSMGGCVVCRWSSLFPQPGRVEHAFFFGVPVRGTFSAVEVLLGRFLLPRLVAGASPFRRKQVLADLGKACAAMPGLVDLLPDPGLFPSAGLLYQHANWPEECAPAQSLLDRARSLKAAMPASPILARTTILAAANWPTPGAVELSAEGCRRICLSRETVPGDGVTPAVSAGPPVIQMRFPHAFLLFEPEGVRNVSRYR